MSTIRISRSRMTACPACQNHIQVAENISETVCPFCQAALVGGGGGSTATPPKFGRFVPQSRGALIAASLLGLSLAACTNSAGSEGADASSNDTATGELAGNSDTAEAADSGVMPLYGMPADIAQDSAPQDLPQAMYGMPADVQPSDVTAAPDQAVAPMYGMAADIQQGEIK